MAIYFGNGSGSPQADRRFEMALQLAEWGDFIDAADLFRQGLEHAPQWPPLHFHLGESLRRSGDHDAALAAFRQYLALDPADAMGAAIKLSLLGATPAPPAMPEEYVRSLFDQYAPRFEKSLVENLSYHTPDLIAALALHFRGHFRSLLDLGCGTGLAAQFFSGKADHMTGVDIAPGMIEQSRAKNIYNDLHLGTIDSFLTHTPARYDLVLAADLFVYVGALELVFKQIENVMETGGLFCLSIQLTENSPWILGADHRYAHSVAYIESLAHEHDLAVLQSQTVDLRLDAGKPVPGMIFAIEK